MAIPVRTLVLAALAACAPVAVQAHVGEPMPRVEAPLCPGIVGLEVAFAEMMVDRIRTNAEALGLKVADPATCYPNLIVAVVPDGQAYVRRLSKKEPYLLADLDAFDRRALLNDSGPVHVISRTVTLSRDGHPVQRRQNLNDVPQTGAWMAHSKIYSAVQREVTHTLVVFDAEAVKGMTVAQMADFATMRALIYDAPKNAPKVNGSVLSLFNAPADARPAGMSDGDRALLATFYKGIPNLPGANRIAAMESVAGHRTAE